MPQAAITWIAGVLQSWGVSAAAASFIATAVVYVAQVVALKSISDALAPKQADAMNQAQRILKSYKGTAEPARVLYGENRAGGHIVAEFLSGENNQYYWRVVVLGKTNGAPYEGVSHIFIDDVMINLSTGLTDDIVNVSAYAGYVMVKTYLGSDTQTADPDLVAAVTEWTTAHEGNGLCYAIIRLERNDEIFSHFPEFTFRVQGAKLYDPRLDSTNGGSGSHRYTDASTWEYSQNAALVLRDYDVCSRYGMGESNSRINDTVVAASANICEETPPVPPSTTQTRYLCDGALFTDNRHADNIAAIRSSMLGVQTYSRGTYKILAGAYTAPTVTLADSDIVSVSIQTVTGENRYNSVRGEYVSADRKSQVTSFVPRSESTYITEDNGETLWRDIHLPMVQNEYRAQRIGTVVLEQSRHKLKATVVCKLTAYQLNVFDTVALTVSEFGWSGKVFRVIGWQFNPIGQVTLALQEETLAAWTDPSTGNYGTPGSTTATPYGSPTPSKPISLVVTGSYGGILVDWQEPADGSAQKYEVAEHTANTPIDDATVVWVGSATNAYRVFAESTTRYYWVRSVSQNGRKSDWVGSGMTTDGVGATSLAPSSVPLGVLLDKSEASGAGATTVTTDTVTATASGGSGTGYTYAWTRVSGSTAITANSPSSAATSFDSTANDVSAVFICTVDDGASNGPVDSPTITVTIGASILEASASPASTNKIFTPPGTKTSATITCTATGGTPSYSYQWVRVSGSTAISITSPTTAATAFQYSDSVDAVATFRCDVTDTIPDEVSTNTVTVRFTSLE